MVITRKIEIVINEDDPIKKKEFKTILYRWRNLLKQAANIAITHKFVQRNLADFQYLTDDIIEKVSVADIVKKEPGLSVQNITFRLMAALVGKEVPSAILSCLNQLVSKNFNDEYSQVRKGERSIRTYKKDMPIPFPVQSIRRLTYDEDNKCFTFILHKIPFKTILGRDRSGNTILLKRCLDDNTKHLYKLCSSSLKIDENGKMYLLACIDCAAQPIETIKDKKMYAYLSINTPILCSSNPSAIEIMSNSYLYEYRNNLLELAGKMEEMNCSIGQSTKKMIEEQYNCKSGKSSSIISIGNKEEFLHRRLEIQRSIRRCQINNRYNVGGKGREKKCQTIEHWHDIEYKYIETKLHTYAKKLVDEARKQKCSTIILCNQELNESLVKDLYKKGDYFLLRNWSYYGLKEKIIYKAKKIGIEVCEEKLPKAIVVYSDKKEYKAAKNFASVIHAKIDKISSNDSRISNIGSYDVVYLSVNGVQGEIPLSIKNFFINNIDKQVIIPFTCSEECDLSKSTEIIKRNFSSLLCDEGIRLDKLSSKEIKETIKRISKLFENV